METFINPSIAIIAVFEIPIIKDLLYYLLTSNALCNRHCCRTFLTTKEASLADLLPIALSQPVTIVPELMVVLCVCMLDHVLDLLFHLILTSF